MASPCLTFIALAFTFTLLAALSSPISGQTDEPTVVEAGALGRIRGGLYESYEDEDGVRKNFTYFRGIPYAKIPSRFSPSLLHEEDLGGGEVFNATRLPPHCQQPLQDPFFLSEDCLFLNIQTHGWEESSTLRPVMVFIHGGAFTVGNGALFSGQRLMIKELVYVTFNYRLGLFGFFSLQNEDVPGNAGMYDVVNALTWVQKYIQYFGGDPGRITVVGQSAGAVAVTQVMASPMGAGLFHRAIAASGSALNAWGTAEGAEVLQGSLDIANRSGCHSLEETNPDYSAIARCMRGVAPADLISVLYDYQVYERRQGRLGFSVVSPVVQDFPMANNPKFLPEHPRLVFEEGREAGVELIMSSTKHDGSYPMGILYNRFLKDNGLEGNSTFLRSRLVPTILNALGVKDSPSGVHETIGRIYMGDSRSSGDFLSMYPGLMDIFSVFFFKGDAYRTALLHSSQAPTYWASFEHEGVSIWGSLFPGEDPPPYPGGITHGDDLIYTHTLYTQPFGPSDAAFSYKLMDVWYNFTSTGIPGGAGAWEPLNVESEPYTILDSNSRVSHGYPDSWVGPGAETLPPPPDPFVIEVGRLGKIRGRFGQTYPDLEGARRNFTYFVGIPYANIAQRFSPSFLRENNLGGGDVFNATTNPLSCYQPMQAEFFLSENCLFINVQTHRTYSNDSDLRPVLVFIHGGAFTVGSGALFSGSRLLNRDLVYVTFNYRLGILGSFSLQNEDVPGNAGMYDVVNALTWVQKYIQYFGGDPADVTIAGQSAGAVAVTQLMASPMGAGLFHRAIAASGSALNAWGTAEGAEVLQGSLDIANRSGCHVAGETPNLEAIALCMRTVNASLLVQVLYDYQVHERRQGRLGFSVISPSVQDFPMANNPKFLPEHPRLVFEGGRQAGVPLLMSSTKHDGSYPLGTFYNRFLRDNGLEQNATFLRNQMIPMILNSLGVRDFPSGIHEGIARNYLGESRGSGDFNEMYPGLMDIFSVFFFKADAYQTAKLHSQRAPTYWFSFDYKGSISFWNSLFPEGRPPFPGGVAHTDDLIYIHPIVFVPLSPEEEVVSDKMVQLWYNFTATGVPGPGSAWEPLTMDLEAFTIVGATETIGYGYGETWVGPGLETVPDQPPPTDVPTTPSPTTTTPPITTTTTTPLPTTTVTEPETTLDDGSSPTPIRVTTTEAPSPPPTSPPIVSSTPSDSSAGPINYPPLLLLLLLSLFPILFHSHNVLV